jgi:hypothetical protein
MQDSFPKKGTNPGEVEHTIRVVGGASAITKVYGPGVSVTYVGSGAFTLTWAENPGTFLGFTYGLQATTPGDVKGHTVVCGAFNTTAFTLGVTLYNASDTGHDLAALEWITMRVTFAPETTSLL